jgi:cupin fold WbuC family metalloprotein
MTQAADRYPRALQSPEGRITVIDGSQLERVVEVSRKSPRGRIILPFHKTDDEKCHRMLNALQPGSYIRPHRHLRPPKTETILVLKGSVCFVIFDSAGRIDSHFTLAAGGPRIGIDIEPILYHTLFALENDTVVFEVKEGPFSPLAAGDFAEWAPPEGNLAAETYLDKLHQLTIG